jgi:hypothetical protein
MAWVVRGRLGGFLIRLWRSSASGRTEVVKALAQRFERRFEIPGLADKIAGDFADAVPGTRSALEVQVVGVR